MKADVKTVWATPAQKKALRRVDSVQPDELSICNDKPPVTRLPYRSKYATMFEQLKPGQALRCQAGHAQAIATSLRKWLDDKGMRDKYRVQTVKDFGDGMGRVWLLEPGQ